MPDEQAQSPNCPIAVLFVGDDFVLEIVSANEAYTATGDHKAVASKLAVATNLLIDSPGRTAEIVQQMDEYMHAIVFQ
jgi:hypothetical protein